MPPVIVVSHVILEGKFGVGRAGIDVLPYVMSKDDPPSCMRRWHRDTILGQGTDESREPLKCQRECGEVLMTVNVGRKLVMVCGMSKARDELPVPREGSKQACVCFISSQGVDQLGGFGHIV